MWKTVWERHSYDNGNEILAQIVINKMKTYDGPDKTYMDEIGHIHHPLQRIIGDTKGMKIKIKWGS